MKSTAIAFTTVLAVAAAAAGGGLAGALGEVGDPPSHDDDTAPAGTGKPGRAAPRKPGPSPTGVRPDEKLRDQVRRLEAKIAAGEKATAANLKPVDSMAEAEKRVRQLQQMLDDARKDLATLDREETARLAKRKRDFDKKWADHAEAIEAGTPPAGMSPLEWARLCDDYYWDKADMQADFASAHERLKRRLDRRTAALDKALREAREHAENVRKRWKDFSPGQRKFMARMMAWKLHQAELLAARQALADLKKLLADLEGSDKMRGDAIESEAVETTGYLLPDRIRQLVLREMQLSDATRYPSDVDLDAGLPHNDWQAILAQPTRQEAKVKWLAEQLRLANEDLRHAEARVKAADEAVLRRMRADGEPPDAVARKARQLDATRPKRTRARQADARNDLHQYRDQLEKEAAELEKMRAATRPAGEGD